MEETEEIELTCRIMQLLLNYTSDPDAWTEKTKHLVVALHKTEPVKVSNRWLVRLTFEDVKTMHFVLNAAGQDADRRTALTRATNLLCGQSATYERIEAEFQEEIRKGIRARVLTQQL